VKSMIVTGAGAGIGRAIAERAAAAGYRVGVLDVQAAPARAAAAALPNAVALRASVADEAQVEAALDVFGTPDVWVSNAGIVRFGPLAEIALADFRAVVDVNLTGTFVGARAAAKRMIQRGQGGAIVNVTSMNGVVPGPNAGAYGASKAAVALLTQQMAIEWGRFGIRVNAVAPGLIDAGMSAPILADPELRRARESRVPLGRLGNADDIARVVLFLASDDAAYVTGQNLLADGGVTHSIISHLPRPASVEKAK
jgi:NAD(P)-dependent dehydrogenase (short-subunit alcohol dehydrogenase family)